MDDEMRPEYDLRGGVRGKYYERCREGTIIVRLEAKVVETDDVPPAEEAESE